MIEPTEDEISFLRKLELRDGLLVLQGNLSLLNIDRLIPDYVIRFLETLTERLCATLASSASKGIVSKRLRSFWALARLGYREWLSEIYGV